LKSSPRGASSRVSRSFSASNPRVPRHGPPRTVPSQHVTKFRKCFYYVFRKPMSPRSVMGYIAV